MAKAISAVDVLADKLIVDAVKTLIATYQQTKLGTQTGTQLLDQKLAEKIIARRALSKTRRGNTGFSGDISSIGQVP